MRKLLLPALTAATLIGSLAVPGSNPAPTAAPGEIRTAAVRSATLRENIAYSVYLPSGYDESTQRYLVLYLLHGRGDTMAAWTQVKSRLDEMIGAGEIPPTIAIMPDAPWSSRASWYVDSAYKGSDPGRPVETAYFRDLVPQIDASYRTIADRSRRAVAGYSMGGAGALRYTLAHPEVFGAAIVLSPAVYFPLPPADSSTREFGAFGKGKDPFSEATYLKLNWPAALKSFATQELRSHLYIAVGDDEYKNPKAVDATHDLDFEAHVVFKPGGAGAEPDVGVPGRRRWSRLGRVGADVRRGGEVHLPVHRQAADGARCRRRSRVRRARIAPAGSQLMPPATFIRRSPWQVRWTVSRTRAGRRRADQVRAGRFESVVQGVGGCWDRTGVRRRRCPADRSNWPG